MTEQEVLAYCKQIMDCDINYIDESLPSFKRDDFLVDLFKIVNELKLNYNVMLDLKHSENSDEFDKDLAELKYKIDYIDNKFLSKSVGNEYKRVPVFANTEAGNPYFLRDLKNIPSEQYDELIKTLNVFLSGEAVSEEKMKVYKNNDIFKRTTVEFKGHQIRVFTAHLKYNIFCVFGLASKKTDNDNHINSVMGNRLNKLILNGNLDSVIEKLDDDLERNKLINEGNEILENVFSILNKKDDDVELLFSDEYYDVEDGRESILEEVIKENKVDDFSDLKNNTVDISSDFNLTEEDTGISSIKNVDNIRVMPGLLSDRKYKVRRETILKDYIRSNIMIMNFDELLNVVKVVSFINFERAIKYHVSIPNVPEVSFEEKPVVVKRGRKPMKETPFRNYIKASIVKFSCDELLRVKNCILDLNIDKSIGEVYDKMMIIPKHQLDRFVLENYTSDIGEKRK